MSTFQELIDTSQDWLLDPSDPGPRYVAMRDIYADRHSAVELDQAAVEAHARGPIRHVLEHMTPQGWWSKAGPGYSPKYRSTVWAVTLLGQLGAQVALDERVETACQYVLATTYAEGGYFSHSGTPSGTFDCLQGNLTWALLAMGCRDARLVQALEWMARSQTGEGVAPVTDRKALVRYHSMKCGPDYRCSANGRLPCAWGATKVMMALGLAPKEWQTELTREATARGVALFFSVDPVTAAWPCDRNINRDWWKFGFPQFYITDLLQVAEALAALGLANNPRMGSLMKLILKKQSAPGRWKLEYGYAGKTWGSFGTLGQENKWVTVRALRVLKAVG